MDSSTKPDIADLCAFGAPCTIITIIELAEKLRKLDNRARMCFFMGVMIITLFLYFSTAFLSISDTPSHPHRCSNNL